MKLDQHYVAPGVLPTMDMPLAAQGVAKNLSSQIFSQCISSPQL
ncbi:hypothetical protein [Deinococcus hohokamensis]|uniref:Uncharacterized protein n=1 Tax=Deinococcus hohokamensis TaxID=309883 RepID=A0ABV9I7M9_9DEIO